MRFVSFDRAQSYTHTPSLRSILKLIPDGRIGGETAHSHFCVRALFLIFTWLDLFITAKCECSKLSNSMIRLKFSFSLRLSTLRLLKSSSSSSFGVFLLRFYWFSLCLCVFLSANIKYCLLLMLLLLLWLFLSIRLMCRSTGISWKAVGRINTKHTRTSSRTRKHLLQSKWWWVRLRLRRRTSKIPFPRYIYFHFRSDVNCSVMICSVFVHEKFFHTRGTRCLSTNDRRIQIICMRRTSIESLATMLLLLTQTSTHSHTHAI